MPDYERSQFGCWTCRVRKKKCDEAYPICASCQMRGITCYGYGPKPEWMDGSDKERRVVEEFKRLVKVNNKQRRLYNSGLPPQHPAPVPVQNGTLNTPPVPPAMMPMVPKPVEPQLMRFSPYCLGTSSADSLPSPPDSHFGASSTGRDPKECETTLLMNYLDHVFPLQFNCYTPPVTELGRGWLLALLTRTKPLYHAALALSAFYMHSILLKSAPRRSSCIDMHWEEMKKHHALAFKELQIQIAGLKDCQDLKSTIETVACIFQMISFEVGTPRL
jgi:hypothetical protein